MYRRVTISWTRMHVQEGQRLAVSLQNLIKCQECVHMEEDCVGVSDKHLRSMVYSKLRFRFKVVARSGWEMWYLGFVLVEIVAVAR